VMMVSYQFFSTMYSVHEKKSLPIKNCDLSDSMICIVSYSVINIV